MARWVRVSGVNGVMIGLRGSCDGPVPDALNDWFGGGLEDLGVDEEPPGGEGTTCDAITPWNGSDDVFSWGAPDTAPYGQTFEVPQTGDTRLVSFTFVVKDAGVPVAHEAAVYEWSTETNRPVGASLFSVFGATGGADTFQPVTYAPDVDLDPTKTFVAFLTASGSFPTGGDASRAHPSADLLPGREFVFLNHGSTVGALFSQSWSVGFLGAGSDVAAEFVFQPPTGG